MSKWSKAEIEAAESSAAHLLGFSSLYLEQRKAITAFVQGCDVFVSLPTGFGKTLCFGVLPWTFDGEKGKMSAGVRQPRIAALQSSVS